MNRERKNYEKSKKHYDYLQSLGYEVVCVCLQGSQNYGLDEYSDEYMSILILKQSYCRLLMILCCGFASQHGCYHG